MNRYVYYGLVGAIFLASFRIYSALFYPLLNSDNAVTILMIHYYKLPNDLYFWGQDRMGSSIQLLAQIPFRYFNLSAIASESIIHYILLLLGFLAFVSFIKNPIYKVLFALVWFFPPMRMIDTTQFSFGIHYSLLALICWSIAEGKKQQAHGKLHYFHAYFILASLLSILCVWVSDMALVSLGVLSCIYGYAIIREKKSILLIAKSAELNYALSATLVGYYFIRFAKSTYPTQNDYALFSDFPTLWKTTQLFSSTILEFLTFTSDEPLTSVYTYFAMVCVLATGLQYKKLILPESKKIWLRYFLAEAILLFIIIICSHWTFLNNVPRRYFTCTYISLAFSFFLFLDNLSLSKKQTNYITILLSSTLLIGGFSTLYNLKFVSPKSLTPTASVVSEFNKLGEIGIIGEYWNSYISSCVNPDSIIATPHDRTWVVRNNDLAEGVFKQKKLYIIRDMWMENFPDSLQQFGRKLSKDGEEFQLANCFLCKYKIVE